MNTPTRLPLANQLANQRVLEGQWAVVTGSTRGIGREIALHLAAAGAHLVIHGRNAPCAADTAQEASLYGGETLVVIADLATSSGRKELLSAAQQARTIDIWINNAGADVLTGPSAALPFAEKLELLWRTDVEGTIDLSRAIGAAMKTQGKGCIVNMGWDQAEQGMEGASGEMFAAVKGAISAFSRSLAQSLAPHVRVNCLAPGWIQTAWGDQADPYWHRRAIGESLRQRWGTPADVAQAAVWLCSPAADFINGQLLPVNGGWRRCASNRTVSGDAAAF